MFLSSQRRILVGLFYLLLTLRCFKCTKGAVILSPSPRAYVCNAEDRLELTCNTTESAMQWRLSSKGNSDPIDLIISSTTNGTRRRMINISQITATRISGRGETPLISMLEINPVTEGLNGTLNVTCMSLGPSMTMATITVHIINPDNGYHPSSPIIETEQEFRPDNITMSLMWSQEIHDKFQIPVSYRVSVQTMMKATLTMVNSAWLNITLLYNTWYNVSVEADFCGHTSATMLMGIYYANCQDPLDTHNMKSNNNYGSLMASGYIPPSLEGSIVNFTCLLGDTLTGPNMSTCMEDGNWEPDPREVSCIGFLQKPGRVTLELSHENDYHDVDPQNQIESDHHLVYADIGPSSLNTNKISNTLVVNEFDDSRVEYAQINHAYGFVKKEVKHSKSVTNKQPPVPAGLIDDSLSVDLDKLLIQLRPQVGPKWYQFGEAAGIEKEILDNYAENCPPEDCIIEMLDYWLRIHSAGKITWRDVARVLRAIGLRQLAGEIESVYTTGRLPILVDMNEMPDSMMNFESVSVTVETPPPVPPKSIQQDNAVPVLMPKLSPKKIIMQ